MVASMKLYNSLGVAADADENAIKKAYKKAALKWHPDRNQENKDEAEKKFKEVAEAYEVLSDAKKRRMYDQVGDKYKEMGSGMGGDGGGGGGDMPQGFARSSFQGDPNEIFKQFFGAGFNPGTSSFDDEDPFSSLFGGMGGKGGGGMRFSSMGGGGGMPFGMGGMGGMGGMQQQQQQKGPPKEFPLECTLEELYNGCTKKRKLTRKRMRSGQFVNDSKIVEIGVQPGWKAGTKVTFPGESDELRSHIPGDIIFVVKEAAHASFKRDGNDLVHTPSLPNESGPVKVPLLTGGNITIRVAAGTKSTTIPEKGMPIRKSGKVIGHGNIVVNPKWK